MAEYESVGKAVSGEPMKVDTVVVGGGIAGMTSAIETAELNKKVFLIEKEASIGGRVAANFQYFPKLCPPTCGIEINLRRIRANANIRVLTLSEVIGISGEPGNFEVEIRVNPRFVNERCTCCGKCEEVCEIERDNAFNFDLDQTKAIYLPHLMAFPPRYVVDPQHAEDERMQACVDACEYDAIDLSMTPQTIKVQASGVVWATGWRPYDASKIDNLGFGQIPNVVTNVIVERMASLNGPTQGKIVRPSDHKEVSKVGFVQCAGSRDENHLPYCSSVCCLASMKQAMYLRSQYPDAEIHFFYIDVRAPGRLEDFYVKAQEDDKFFFHRGKVGRISEDTDTRNVVLEAENTLTGEITRTEVDLAVLAVGMVPNTADTTPAWETTLDEYGFIVNDGQGVIGAGTVVRPFEVSGSIQDATGAALKAINMGSRS